MKEASVVIVAVSAHRRASLDATSEAIDLLKEKVPIWKKEHYANENSDTGAWKVNPEFKILLN